MHRGYPLHSLISESTLDIAFGKTKLPDVKLISSYMFYWMNESKNCNKRGWYLWSILEKHSIFFSVKTRMLE